MPSSSADADGDIGVAGEIVIELQRVGVDGDQRFGARVELGQVEDAVDQILGQVIRDQQFFDESQRDQKQRGRLPPRSAELCCASIAARGPWTSNGSGEGGGEE